MKFYRFFFLAVILYFLVNIASTLILTSLVSSTYAVQLMQSVISNLGFLLAFDFVVRHYVPTAPPGFRFNFIIMALLSFLFYALLTLIFGESLLRVMGFRLSPVPAGSNLAPDEYATLSFFTYGFSSLTNGLLSLSVAYYLQKYMVRGIFYVFKRFTHYANFIEVDRKGGKSSFLITVLWLLLLPFPIQQVLTPNPAGVSVLGTGLYLLSALALFLMWGLGLAGLIGVAKKNIFRLYGTVQSSLFWFLLIQWFSALVYTSVSPPIVPDWFGASSLLLLRVVFVFGPPALISAYVYKRVLEKRAEVEIIEYLKRKESLEMSKITVTAEKPSAT